MERFPRKVQVRKPETKCTNLLGTSTASLTQGVTRIAMEATIVYWKPVWNLLSDGEFELVSANTTHIRNVPGRKIDVNDDAWLASLVALGLILSSSVTNEPTL